MNTFRRASQRMPAYKAILKESGISPDDIKTIEDFRRLPILDKHKTFQRCAMHELSMDGKLGPVSWVLTSSGMSGIFSFGLYDPPGAEDYKKRIDEALDAVFAVATRKSLLLNCLPMGVKLFSEYCTLGEVSVREDMACALMKAFGPYYEQTILVGETAFIKRLLELGIQKGIDWKTPLVHVILGEELVAENARRYIESILGTSLWRLEKGMVGASMGVGELGLNLFFEVPPPSGSIMRLRRLLHDDLRLREMVLGQKYTTVPALFSYDPDRIYVEFVNGKLVVTTLDAAKPIPMVRYTSDDDGGFLDIPEKAWPDLEKAGITRDSLDVPLIMVKGRGKFALSGETKVYPEEVKEGLYHDFELAKLTTANFRLVSGSPAKVRIQLSPGIEPGAKLAGSFAQAIAKYATCPLDVTCEAFQSFQSGMNVDYERKYDYFGS